MPRRLKRIERDTNCEQDSRGDAKTRRCAEFDFARVSANGCLYRDPSRCLLLVHAMSPQNIAKLIGVGLLIFCVVVMASSGTYVVKPGFRGVEVTMGKVSSAFKPEGFGLRAPFITTIDQISIRQQTAEDKAECYSADLQQFSVGAELGRHAIHALEG